nr:MAG TPA: Protein of unknown function (DUF1642) [Caudoviricetes sp.]
MDDWTRVLLYGTFDGFAYSTDGFPLTVVILDSGERVEVPEECVVSADRMVNKNKIKLKDVIARIKKLDFDSQEVWLNEILNELGSDYGSLKYRAGYEQGKLEGLIEREIVTVPRFVADWIEYFKNCKGTLYGSTNPFSYYGRAILEDFEGDYEEVLRWIRDNSDTYARAWLDGYTVEKNKRYFVRLKGVVDNLRLLRHNSPTNTWTIGSEEQCFNVSRAHTRKELEEAGFEEVFNSPLFEVKEVEE